MGLLNIIGIIFMVAIALSLILWLYLERSLWVRSSTRDFFALSNMKLLQKLEGYFYGVRADLYLKPAAWSRLVRHLEGSTADEYHGKVITGNDAAKIIKLDHPVSFKANETVIPYPVARSIILEGRPPVAVMECPCRAQKPDACQPRDVCMIVGDPFVSLILEHKSGNARRITTGEALQILQEEEERGHIHTAWFKTVMHDRFYAICNCCTCCCLGMASYNRNVPRIVHSGYQPHITSEGCIGCGQCEEICPFQAMDCTGGLPVVDTERCMGCGICVSHCPVQAIELFLAPERGIPLDLERLA